MRMCSTVVAYALVAGICLSAHGAGDTNSLLAKSSVIGTMGGAPDPNYWWLTSDKIICFEHVPHAITASQRNAMEVPSDYAPGHFRAFTLDVKSDQRAPFGTFNAAIGDTIRPTPMLMSFGGGPATETEYIMPSCAMSPDGAWFTWRSWPDWRVARFDGTGQQSAQDRSPDGYVCWLSNRNWAVVDTDYRNNSWIYTNLTVHDVTGAPERKVAVNKPESGLLMGATDRAALLSIDYVSQEQIATSSVPADEFAITGRAVKTTHYTISLPGVYRVWSANLSNRGDRLAWVLSDGDDDFVYVSDTAGKRWTDLGEVNRYERANGSGEQVSWPTGIRWLPDDKALSFVFDGKLYRIGVPV
jgi:hypothetical protein